jgi:hypothetical protein
MRALLLAGLVPALGLAGCATTVEPPPPPLLAWDRADCDASPDLGRTVSLTPKKETAVHVVSTPLGYGSPCLSQEGGAGPYVVYALPTDLHDKTLIVGGLLGYDRIFSPRVRVLDAEGRETRGFVDSDWFSRGPVYSVQFRPRPGDAFVVVSADPSRVGRTESAINVGTNTTVIYTGYGASNWTTGQERHATRVFAYDGEVRVTINDTDTEEDPDR